MTIFKFAKTWTSLVAGVLLLLSTGLSANESKGTSTMLNFSFKEKKLSEILQVFSDASGVNILTDEEIQDLKITLKLENVTIEKALSELGKKYDLLVTDSIDNVIHISKLIKININIKSPITLNNILKLFERASDRDIIPSIKVLEDKRKLRLSIRNAPFKDALTTIVKAFDFVWFQDSNGFIIVAKAKRMESEMVTRVLRLNYRGVSSIQASESDSSDSDTSTSINLENAGGADAGSSQAVIIDILKNTIKSPFGKIVYDADTNSIIITDLPNKIRSMQKLLDKLDIRPTQLLISAKFVSIDTDNSTNFGLDWVNGLAIGAQGADITSGIAFPFTSGNSGFEEDIAIAAGPNATAGDSIYTLGSLTFSQTQLSLKLLKEYANGEIIQEPSITTLDNKQATIGVTKDIYYVESNTVISQAATNIENEVKSVSSGITLVLVAHATGKNGDIVVNAQPKANTFIKFNDLNGTIVPEIEERMVNTTMIIKDGMTGVMGGLKFTSNVNNRRQLPLLGRIPGLGWLFKKKTTSKSDKELLIYISPKIIVDHNSDKLVDEINSLSASISQDGLFPKDFSKKTEEIPTSKYKRVKVEEKPAEKK